MILRIHDEPSKWSKDHRGHLPREPQQGWEKNKTEKLAAHWPKTLKRISPRLGFPPVASDRSLIAGGLCPKAKEKRKARITLPKVWR